MGVSLSFKAYSGKESSEFQKHYKSVKFCIENELSFTIETVNFFKGKIDCGDSQKELIVENDMLYVLQDNNKSSNMQRQSAKTYLTKTLKRSKEWVEESIEFSHKTESVNPLFWN